ncbi:uncharacterized protein LOC142363963 [Opisthocomus hoazin]|uniref:uncharacterized protein LOC142363963 n=1 Tax=Opisthocomus hoazin TaxID=30419 RepID=UPI003F52AB6E
MNSARAIRSQAVFGERPGWLWVQVVNAAVWSPATSLPFLLTLNDMVVSTTSSTLICMGSRFMLELWGICTVHSSPRITERTGGNAEEICFCSHQETLEGCRGLCITAARARTGNINHTNTPGQDSVWRQGSFSAEKNIAPATDVRGNVSGTLPRNECLCAQPSLCGSVRRKTDRCYHLPRWLRSNFKQQGSLALAVFITPFLAEKLVTI